MKWKDLLDVLDDLDAWSESWNEGEPEFFAQRLGEIARHKRGKRVAELESVREELEQFFAEPEHEYFREDGLTEITESRLDPFKLETAAATLRELRRLLAEHRAKRMERPSTRSAERLRALAQLRLEQTILQLFESFRPLLLPVAAPTLTSPSEAVVESRDIPVEHSSEKVVAEVHVGKSDLEGEFKGAPEPSQEVAAADQFPVGAGVTEVGISSGTVQPCSTEAPGDSSSSDRLQEGRPDADHQPHSLVDPVPASVLNEENRPIRASSGNHPLLEESATTTSSDGVSDVGAAEPESEADQEEVGEDSDETSSVSPRASPGTDQKPQETTAPAVDRLPPTEELQRRFCEQLLNGDDVGAYLTAAAMEQEGIVPAVTSQCLLLAFASRLTSILTEGGKAELLNRLYAAPPPSSKQEVVLHFLIGLQPVLLGELDADEWMEPCRDLAELRTASDKLREFRHRHGAVSREMLPALREYFKREMLVANASHHFSTSYESTKTLYTDPKSLNDSARVIVTLSPVMRYLFLAGDAANTDDVGRKGDFEEIRKAVADQQRNTPRLKAQVERIKAISVKGGVKVDHRGGVKIDHFESASTPVGRHCTGGWSEGLRRPEGGAYRP